MPFGQPLNGGAEGVGGGDLGDADFWGVPGGRSVEGKWTGK